MRTVVDLKLAFLGYEVTEADEAILDLLIEEQTQWVLTEINLRELPAELEGVTADRVVGQFLRARLMTGTLPGIVQEQIVRSIQEGKVSVQFSEAASDADKVLALAQMYSTRGNDQWSAFRKIRW